MQCQFGANLLQEKTQIVFHATKMCLQLQEFGMQRVPKLIRGHKKQVFEKTQ